MKTPPTTSPHSSGWRKPVLTLGELLRQNLYSLLPCLSLCSEQRRVLYILSACRTKEMGGHLDVCDHCGHEQPVYNSCRDRHCPNCQGLAGAKWVEKRMKSYLPTHYFHSVFTVPAELRPLFLGNFRALLELLFKKTAETLQELAANPKWLGAQLGFTLVLHTWAKDLQLHPHIHAVITGGGLMADRKTWKWARAKYLFPVRVLSALFRGKFLAGLKALHQAGELKFTGKQAELGRPEVFEGFLRKLYGK